MRRNVIVVAISAWLAGCAALGEPGMHAIGAGDDRTAASAGAGGPIAAPPVEPIDVGGPVAPFSALYAVDQKGPWRHWAIHPTKPPTRYRSIDAGGVRVIEALADGSISGLKHVLDLDPTQRPILEWRWRIDAPLQGADIEDRFADDSPVRVVLAFDGEHADMPLKDQMLFERVKLLTGQDLPYATLMYVWCNRRPSETITQNAHTSRVRKIVVESGTEGARSWLSYRRDIVADYERAYGRPPGRLIAIGVISDSDNTRQVARGWYGDIRLLPRQTADAAASSSAVPAALSAR